MTTRELSHESQFVTSQQISNSFSAAHSSRHGSIVNFFFRAQPPAPNFCQVIATLPAAAAASISSRPATFSSAKPPKTFKLFHGWNPRKAFKTFVNFLKLTENSFILQEKMEKCGKWGQTASAGPREKGEPSAQRADNATIHQTFRSAAPNQSRKYRTHSMTGLTKKKKNAQPDKSTHFRLHKQQNSPENSKVAHRSRQQRTFNLTVGAEKKKLTELRASLQKFTVLHKKRGKTAVRIMSAPPVNLTNTRTSREKNSFFS